MIILHCSANMRKKFKMSDSQSPPENQLKRHVLVWVTATLLIRWKVNLETRLRDRNSLYWDQNIRIKFPIKFLIKFRTFWCQFHILYVNKSHEIRNHKNRTLGTSTEHKWFKWGIVCTRCVKIKNFALITCSSLREKW